IEEDKSDTRVISEPGCTMEMPADWKEAKHVQNRVSNYYEWRSTKQGADDRRLLLHIDKMPPSYKIVQMQPLTVDGDGFRLGNLSGNCINFATGAGTEQRSQGNAPV